MLEIRFLSNSSQYRFVTEVTGSLPNSDVENRSVVSSSSEVCQAVHVKLVKESVPWL